ncbi:MAG: trigger factor, partial [Candidatus Puniceispirillales bacterium]
HDHDHDHKVDENMSDDEKDEASLIAKRRVKLGIVLTTIGQKNKLQVSEEEKNRAIYVEAQRYPGQQKEVLEYFSKNPEAAQQLAGPIFENKVVDYILDLCKVTDKTVTAEELYKNDEFEDLKAKSKASAGKAKAKAKKAPAKAAVKKPAAKSDAKKPAAKKAPAKKAPAKKATSSKKADS